MAYSVGVADWQTPRYRARLGCPSRLSRDRRRLTKSGLQPPRLPNISSDICAALSTERPRWRQALKYQRAKFEHFIKLMCKLLAVHPDISGQCAFFIGSRLSRPHSQPTRLPAAAAPVLRSKTAPKSKIQPNQSTSQCAVGLVPMSAVGHFPTNRHVRATSGSAPIADINQGKRARQAARRSGQTGRV